MATITNNTDTNLFIGSVHLKPKSDTEVKNWDALKDTGAVPLWLEGDLIAETDGKKEPTKKEMIAALAEAGIEVDAKTKVADVRELYAELDT